ncbi:hypothetical protein ACQ4PT_039171 [Festuca glaucescens]
MAASCLLIACVVTAAGDDGAILPHLQLPGTPDPGHGHGSDAPPPQGQLMDIMSTGGCRSSCRARLHDRRAMAGLAAPFLIGLLLFAPGAAAGGGDDWAPHLQLPGTPDSGRGHGSDASPQGLMADIMSMSGCGSFAALVAATPNASDVFQQRLLPGSAGAGGLTVFCPDDKAVAAFEPTFGALADSDRLDVLLHHAAASRYVPAQLAAFDWVAVRTLAANSSQSITVRDDGDTVWPWPSPTSCCQGSVARVIKTASEEGPLAVYLVDAVLLPGHLRQKLDGGYLAWLHCSIPVWVGLCWVLSAIVGFLSGCLLVLGALWGICKIKGKIVMH